MNSQKAEPELSIEGSQIGGVRQCTISETPSNRSSAELSQAGIFGNYLWIAKIIFIEIMVHKHVFMAFFVLLVLRKDFTIEPTLSENLLLQTWPLQCQHLHLFSTSATKLCV